MFKLACKIPQKVEVALSGGPDSVALLGFLAKSRRDVSAAFIHHGTKTSTESLKVVIKVCKQVKVPLRMTTLTSVKQGTKGLEATWRDMRYDFLDQAERAVVTAHHLDDATEWWIFSSLHGEGKLIPRIRGNYLRPFLLTRKEKLIEYCKYNNLPFYIDETNLLTDRPRVLIRNKMMYDCLEINPGLHKTIKKKYLKEIEDERQGW
jgi:tRNA(Ile)-lysidine synthase|tara:strand:- start:18 stop:635 length:618 start_codon:yes stop_codon:yes gene_type:complete